MKRMHLALLLGRCLALATTTTVAAAAQPSAHDRGSERPPASAPRGRAGDARTGRGRAGPVDGAQRVGRHRPQLSRRPAHGTDRDAGARSRDRCARHCSSAWSEDWSGVCRHGRVDGNGSPGASVGLLPPPCRSTLSLVEVLGGRPGCRQRNLPAPPIASRTGGRRPSGFRDAGTSIGRSTRTWWRCLCPVGQPCWGRGHRPGGVPAGLPGLGPGRVLCAPGRLGPPGGRQPGHLRAAPAAGRGARADSAGGPAGTGRGSAGGRGSEFWVAVRALPDGRPRRWRCTTFRICRSSRPRRCWSCAEGRSRRILPRPDGRWPGSCSQRRRRIDEPRCPRPSGDPGGARQRHPGRSVSGLADLLRRHRRRRVAGRPPRWPPPPRWPWSSGWGPRIRAGYALVNPPPSSLGRVAATIPSAPTPSTSWSTRTRSGWPTPPRAPCRASTRPPTP